MHIRCSNTAATLQQHYMLQQYCRDFAAILLYGMLIFNRVNTRDIFYELLLNKQQATAKTFWMLFGDVFLIYVEVIDFWRRWSYVNIMIFLKNNKLYIITNRYYIWRMIENYNIITIRKDVSHNINSIFVHSRKYSSMLYDRAA